MRGRSRHLDGTGLTSLLLHQSQRSLVKTVQYGTVAIAGSAATNTATLATAVVLANSVIIWLGSTWNGAGPETVEGRVLSRVSLTNTTTVTGDRGTATSGTAMTVGFVVLEFQPGVIKAVQRGTISLNSLATNTAALSGFTNTAKILVNHLGDTGSDAGSYNAGTCETKLALTSVTVLTADRNTGQADALTVGYQVVEFF